MNPYLATKTNIPEGYGHELFSLTHILTLLFTAALIYAVSRVYRRVDEKSRITIKRVIAFLLIADEILKDGNALLTGQWEWGLLPLHLCSVNIFIILYEAFSDSETAKNYLYAVCIPGAICALIFPSWITSLPYFGLMSLHSWSVHILLLMYPILLLSGGFIPDWHKFFRARVIIPFAFFLAFDYFFNNAFNTDFFFLRKGGEGNPLSFFESILPDPLYIVFVLVLLVLMVVMMYFINFLIKKRRGLA